jgi:gliding motility-associated-like protein
MKKICYLSTLVLTTVLLGKLCVAQDFSNKGKDFWVGYGYHSIMVGGNGQEMVLYFSAEQAANVTVSIPGLGYSQNYFVPANSVVTSNPIPKNGLQDARLTAASTAGENKGIHITSDKPIVAYAHIYNQSVSGATILFPTNTLGKEYYSINFTNTSNTANIANCWFYVVATDPGTTTVEITPSAATTSGYPVGVPFTVNLTQGQIYNVMGTMSGNNGEDLTGSIVKSVNTGSGCKRIGVFSGSGRISITCNGSTSSSDNYMVQATPRTAWGKTYLTSPTAILDANNRVQLRNDVFRVCVADPTTVVKVNGNPIGLPLLNNFYYQLAQTQSPLLIEADKPIMVSQYATSQGACGNSGFGDPEVFYLSPVEQNISRVIWNATPNFAIAQHFINVIIPNGGTGISSFRFDGNPLPIGSFTAHPNSAAYSIATINVTAGQHTILSDSGFNAIAYGFGSAESYGYNAGTNIKDIYQFISLQNQYATVNFPATCKNTPFFFSMTFPYQPTRIQWQFGAALNAMGIADQDITSPVPTSTSVVNGRTLYTYTLPGSYNITAAGTYPIRVIATNPTPDGCGGIQEIDFDVQVFDPPTADFSFTTNGCVSNPVQFTSINNNGNGRPVTAWNWDFGDVSTGTGATVSHTYAAGGSYTVKHRIITDVGCISDEVSHVVNLSDPPVANFTPGGPYCAGKVINFDDQSTIPAPGAINKWTWNFGDGSPVVVVTAPGNPDQTHTYATAGSYIVTLQVETAAGCQSTVYSFPVEIKANPVANFNQPSACLPAGTAQFTDLSTIANSTINQWSWDFGDGSPLGTIQNPTHNYTTGGPFNVTLVVTTTDGCTDTKVQTLSTIYAEPQAAFGFPAEVCLGNPASFTDQSTAAGSSVTGWSWNFGDGSPLSTLQNPTHTYAAAGTYTVTLNVTTAAGCQTVNNVATHTVVVNPLPTISFTNSSPVCENSNILFTSTSTANAGVFTTYSWTVNSSPTGGNSPTLNYIPTAPGTYAIGLTATTDKGCTKTGTSSITVNAKPAANFNLPVACLPAGTANFTSTSTISTGSITGYSWNFGDGSPVSTAQNPTHNYTTSGPFTVSLTVTSDNGCTDTKTQTLSTIYAEPQAAFTNTPEVCLGGSASFTDQSTAPGSTVTSWSWNFGDGSPVSTLQNPTHTYTTAGTYTVTLNITSAAGCQTVNNVATHNVVVNPLPQANFDIVSPGCIGKEITFNDLSVANAGAIIKWTWNFGDGNTIINTTGGPVTHTYASLGSFTVTLQVETDKGCVSTVASELIEINVLPTAEFVAPEACIGDVASQFLDQSTISAGSVVGWSWNFGDPNANGGNPNTSTAQNATHQYTAAGPYTATLVVTSDKGCTDDVSHNFFVNGSTPVAGFTVANSNNLCSNQVVNITDNSSIDVGSLVKVEIFWDYTNDPSIKTVNDNPSIGAGYSHTYPEFFTPASRTVTIRYVAYSGATCLSTFDRIITLLATPQLQFGAVPEICEDAASFQVTQAQMLNGLPGTGVFTGAGINSTGLFNPAAAGTGQHPITYTYTGTNGCVNSLSNFITVNPKPALNAGPDKFILEGGSTVLTPALNSNVPVTYLWTPSTGLSSTTIASPTATPVTDITYTLTVTSDKGCIASDDVFVKVLKSLLIPNIFSPNGDGVHDRWVVPYLESYPGCTIDIYNRYGQLVYHSVGYATPWDGKVNGKEVPVGTYYYVIDPKNGRSKQAGYVDVIR